MANIARERIMEISKLEKASARRIDLCSKDIEKIDAQIKELTKKKQTLVNSICSERNAKVKLDELVKQMDSMPDEMANYLYIGFMNSYGLETNVNPVTVEEKKRAQSVFYLDGYKDWSKEVSLACNGNKQNAVMNRVYNYLRRNYGVVFEQEKKDFYKANGRYPKKTKELMFWVEQTKPVHKGITLACTHTIVSEMYSNK